MLYTKSQQTQMSIRKARKLLRELYQNINKNNIVTSKILCMTADKELLESLDNFYGEDGINVEGKPCKPNWIEKDK